MNFKEKNKAYIDLKAEQHAEADLKLLFQLDPNNSQNLNKFSRNPRFYSGDILYSLLELTDRDSIIAYRREWLSEEPNPDNGSGAPADPANDNTEKDEKQNPENNSSETPADPASDNAEKDEKQNPENNSSEAPADTTEGSEGKDEDADASSGSDEGQKKRS